MWEESPELDASTSGYVAEHQITLFMTLYDMTLLYLFLLPLPLPLPHHRKFKKMKYDAYVQIALRNWGRTERKEVRGDRGKGLEAITKRLLYKERTWSRIGKVW